LAVALAWILSRTAGVVSTSACGNAVFSVLAPKKKSGSALLTRIVFSA